MIFSILTTMIVFLSLSNSVYALGKETEPIIDVDKSVTELQEIIDKQFNTDLSNFPFYQNAIKAFNERNPGDSFGPNYFCYHSVSDAETSQFVSCLVFNDDDKGLISLNYNDTKKRFSFLPFNYIPLKPFSIFQINSTGIYGKSYEAAGTLYSDGWASTYHLTSDVYFFTNLDSIPLSGSDSMKTLRTSDGTLFNANDVFLKKNENGLWQINSTVEPLPDLGVGAYIGKISHVIYSKAGDMINFFLDNPILLIPIVVFLLTLLFGFMCEVML